MRGGLPGGVVWALTILLLLSKLRHVFCVSVATGSVVDGAPQSKDVIVKLKDFHSLISLRAMCSRTKAGYTIKAAALGLGSDCHMPHICKRVYSSLFSGFAGSLTQEDMSKIQRCLPRAILYEEDDMEVKKLEGKQRHNPIWLGNMTKYKESVKGFGGNGLGQYYFKEVNPDVVEGFDETGENSTQELEQGLWSLDRVDQRSLPLDRTYDIKGTGKGVTVYVLDSGIRFSHQEFSNRAISGYDYVDDDDMADDCDGHGTHIAATAAGVGVGIAKDAKIVAVRILNCDGDGKVSDTVAALDFVAKNVTGPSVVILSLGIEGPSAGSRLLEEATKTLVRDYGVVTVVASGNAQLDACYVSPANVNDAITVAASDVPTKYEDSGIQEDIPYYWSNMGSCVDIFAPGVDIYSACGSPKRCNKLQDDSYTLATGTSMAAPAVAGAAAVYLEKHPSASPREVKDAILDESTDDLINSEYFPPDLFLPGTPNKLLYV